MKTLKITLLAICYVATALIGCLVGLALADEQARTNMSDQSIDYVAYGIEHETGETVKDYRWSNDYKLLTIETYEGNIYHFKIKKVAPFRYEWVYVEL